MLEALMAGWHECPCFIWHTSETHADQHPPGPELQGGRFAKPPTNVKT